MVQTTKKQLPIYMLLLLTSNFYCSHIIYRAIYQSIGKLAWVFSIGIALLILITSYYLFKQMKIAQKTPLEVLKKSNPIMFQIMRFLLSIHLWITAFFSIVAIYALIYTYWLLKTPVFLTAIIFLILVSLCIQPDLKALLRVSSVFSFIILGMYCLYVFKFPFDLRLPTLLPTATQLPDNLTVGLIASLSIVIDHFIILFFIQESDEEPKYSIFFIFMAIHAGMLIIDSIASISAFGDVIRNVSYSFFESWRIINFGEFIGNLDQLGLVNLLLSCFLNLSLNGYIIAKSSKHFHISKLIYLLLILIASLYSFNNLPVYINTRTTLGYIAVTCLLISIVIMIVLLRKRKENLK